MKTAPEILQVLQEEFPGRLVKSELNVADPFAVVEWGAILEVCTFLKNNHDMAFDTLACLSGVDCKRFKGEPERMEVVYHLFSMKLRHKFVLKVELSRENPSLSTVEGIWANGNWHEREAYDMFGIRFEGIATCAASFAPMTGKDIRSARTMSSRRPIAACRSNRSSSLWRWQPKGLPVGTNPFKA